MRHLTSLPITNYPYRLQPLATLEDPRHSVFARMVATAASSGTNAVEPPRNSSSKRASCVQSSTAETIYVAAMHRTLRRRSAETHAQVRPLIQTLEDLYMDGMDEENHP